MQFSGFFSLDYGSFLVSLEIGRFETSNHVLLCQEWTILHHLNFYRHFLISLPISPEKPAEI